MDSGGLEVGESTVESEDNQCSGLKSCQHENEMVAKRRNANHKMAKVMWTRVLAFLPSLITTMSVVVWSVSPFLERSEGER